MPTEGSYGAVTFFPGEKATADKLPKTALPARSEKLRVDLVPLRFIEGLAEPFAYGAKKYEPWGWLKHPMSRWIMKGSARRHVIKSDYELIDDESGIDHRLHAAWNLLVDWYYDVEGIEREATNDDRPGTAS